MAVVEQVVGIPGLARKELVNASQQPSLMDPYASIRGPLYMVLLVHVTLCFGRFHELLQLKVNPIHVQLDCSWRDAVTVPVNSEQFLENQVPVKKLIQHQYLLFSNLVGGTIKEPASNRNDLRRHIAKNCLLCNIHKEHPMIPHPHLSG